MAIRNFLSLVGLVLVSFVLNACSHTPPRPARDHESPQPPHAAPQVAPNAGAAQAPGAVPPPTAPTAAQPGPTEAIHLGIILGPGGTRALSQIGVLRELEKAQIPIEHIVGLEWGAMIAGLYAVQGKSNDLEWQIFKLKNEDLPRGKLFQSAIEPGSMEALKDFFKQTVDNRKLSDLHLKFACPAQAIAQERVVWLQSGYMRDVLSACTAYPPLFDSKNGYLAAPLELQGAVAYLKSKGINRIVLVNVLSAGGLTTDQKFQGGSVLETLWREIRNSIRTERMGIDWVIDVPTKGTSFNDIDAGRNLVGVGQKAAQSIVPQIAKSLGL